MDIEARHGDDIETTELDILWASLNYATFNTNMITMTPYKKKLDVYRYELPDLRSRIRNRIYIVKQRLTEMTSPIQSPLHEHIYREYIKRIKELTLEANIDLLDIKAKYENDIEATELENFKTSLTISSARRPQTTPTCVHGKHLTPGPQLEPTARTMSLTRMKTPR